MKLRPLDAGRAGSSSRFLDQPMNRPENNILTTRRRALAVASLALAGLLALAAATAGATATGAGAQRGPTSIELTPFYATEAGHPGSSFKMGLGVRLDEGYHVNSEAPLDRFLIPTELVLEPVAGISVERFAFPEAMILKQAGDLELAVFEEEFVIGVSLRLAADLGEGDYVVPATLKYQACDETTCYSPTSRELEFRISVVAPSVAIRPAPDQALFAAMVFDVDPPTPEGDLDDAGSGTDSDPDPDPDSSPIRIVDDISVLERLEEFNVAGTTGGYLPAEDFLEFISRAESGEAERGFFEGRGPLAVLALTLLGGLALNLTPCVLPMIPINLAIIGAGSQAGSRARGFTLGTAYGLAMALVYGILGLAVILTAGTFGTINASPWFNLGIAVLFIVLALAMFDKLSIDFSRLQSKFDFGERRSGSFLVAFGMGGVAALLAGACVAPVVIQVIVFASNLYATGTTEALALPFFLGVGMALPWPIAGAGLSFLPKPGPWMVRVKQVMGAFILATAVYYGFLAYGLFSQYWVDPDEVAGSVAELVEDGWYTSLSAALEEAEADNKLVLVDMWATWCKNCLVMDKTTLKDPAVVAALEDYVKVKFQAEDATASPTGEVMEHFDAIGLPAYAILRPAPR